MHLVNALEKPQEYDDPKLIDATSFQPAVKKAAVSKAVELTNRLQTSLDIRQLLIYFSQELETLVQHKQLIYAADEMESDISIGRGGVHRSNYKLVVGDGEEIGVISFLRDHCFSDTDREMIEYLLTQLVYPLRNALLFREAMEAASKDSLTGVNNRVTFNNALNREVNVAHRYSSPFTLLCIDIDRFKLVNDCYGHVAGDLVLKNIADMVVDSVRSSDVVFRYGGEEFVVMLSNTALKGASLLAERIRGMASQMEYAYQDKIIGVTLSIGVAELLKHESSNSIFNRADEALYVAKNAGRNAVRVHAANSP